MSAKNKNELPLWLKPGFRIDKEASTTDPLKYIAECGKNFDDIKQLDQEGSVFLVNGCENIKHILVDNTYNYLQEGVLREFSDYFGEGLLSSNGKKHQQDRRVLKALFKHNVIEQEYAQVIVNEIQKRMASWPLDQEINFMAEMMELSVIISGKLVFGLDEDKDVLVLFDQVRYCHRRFMKSRFRKRIQLPDFLSLSHYKYLSMTRKFRDSLANIVDQQSKSDMPSYCMLKKLLDIREKELLELSETDLLDHLATFFLATYESVANSMTWTVYLLSENPDYQVKVLQEIAEVFGDEPIKIDRMKKLKYTASAVNESMRLFPSPWLFWRKAVAKDVLPSGDVIPKDAFVLISPYVTHKNPRYFPDPESFYPERFMGENKSLIPKFAYIPFGIGPRVCIGAQLGQLIALSILSQVLPRFRFSYQEKQRPEQETISFFTAQPKNGNFYMHIEARH